MSRAKEPKTAIEDRKDEAVAEARAARPPSRRGS